MDLLRIFEAGMRTQASSLHLSVHFKNRDMIVLISPAKTLDFEENSKAEYFTLPRFTDEASRIMQTLKKKSTARLMQLQNISRELAELNFERNQSWQEIHHEGNSKQAISAFHGEVYLGLNESDFTEEDYLFAQEHLRILSGLYGLLKPLDLIQPYRLEMGTPLKTTRGKNLYEFWKHRITEHLDEELYAAGLQNVVNLASEEYFKAIHPNKCRANFIQPIFQEDKSGKRSVISVYAKRARGLMSRFVIKNRINDPEMLKAFDAEGYYFDTHQSDAQRWYFVRQGVH
jgi:cytoplasmic iron level regulating protein YaaA (DUF328/UPF0246 family)